MLGLVLVITPAAEVGAAEHLRAEQLRVAAAVVEARLAAASDEPDHRLAHVKVALATARRSLDGREPETLDTAAPEVRHAAARLLRGLARAELMRNRVEAAESAVGRALRLAPQDGVSLAVQAEVAVRGYAPRKAIAATTTALHLRGEKAVTPVTRALVLRLRARALLMLELVNEAAVAAAKASELVFADEEARALAAFAARRRQLHLTEPRSRETSRHLIQTDLDDSFLRGAVSRILAIEPELQRLFPLPAGGRGAWRTRVVLLSAEAYDAVAPPNGAGARAFYQRDSRAIYLDGANPERLRRLLAHEACHAHLHRLLEEPPVWFDEGFADYAAMLPVSRKAAWPDPHPIRSRDLCVLLFEGHDVRFRELSCLTREGLYRPGVLARYFPFCWGYMYFLRHGAGGTYRASLDRYSERVLVGASPEEALATAFARTDLPELEATFRVFVGTLSE
ncbi:hypothetical protein ACFL59_07280 [Planctomycetota bacterium]